MSNISVARKRNCNQNKEYINEICRGYKTTTFDAHFIEEPIPASCLMQSCMFKVTSIREPGVRLLSLFMNLFWKSTKKKEWTLRSLNVSTMQEAFDIFVESLDNPCRDQIALRSDGQKMLRQKMNAIHRMANQQVSFLTDSSIDACKSSNKRILRTCFFTLASFQRVIITGSFPAGLRSLTNAFGISSGMNPEARLGNNIKRDVFLAENYNISFVHARSRAYLDACLYNFVKSYFNKDGRAGHVSNV